MGKRFGASTMVDNQSSASEVELARSPFQNREQSLMFSLHRMKMISKEIQIKIGTWDQ
jgi:hypothetical protein